MSYKIYKKNNQVFIDNTENNNSFSGVIGISTINKIPKNDGSSSSFMFMNFPHFYVKEIKLEDILKENGTAYTAIEWEAFYTALSSSAPVTGPLTDAELRASSINVTTALPIGASTSALQTTSNTKLDSIITNTNVTKGTGIVDSNTQRVTLATDGPSVANLQTIATNTTTTKGSGVSDATTQRVTVATDQILQISPRPNTTGSNGTTPYKLISLATTNANVIKASGGNLYSIIAIGLTSTVRYLKLYNKATAPTVGTDIPLMTIPIPANTQGAGIAIPFSMGVNFSLGLGIAITSGLADNNTGAILANDVVVNLTYA